MNSETRFRETTKLFGVLKLDVEVLEDRLCLRLLPIQRSSRDIALRRVRDVRVATYAASRYGGWHWGMRTSPGGNTVYRLRGDRGVELLFDDGRLLFIGSQRPEQLRGAIAPRGQE